MARPVSLSKAACSVPPQDLIPESLLHLQQTQTTTAPHRSPSAASQQTTPMTASRSVSVLAAQAQTHVRRDKHGLPVAWEVLGAQETFDKVLDALASSVSDSTREDMSLHARASDVHVSLQYGHRLSAGAGAGAGAAMGAVNDERNDSDHALNDPEVSGNGAGLNARFANENQLVIAIDSNGPPVAGQRGVPHRGQGQGQRDGPGTVSALTEQGPEAASSSESMRQHRTLAHWRYRKEDWERFAQRVGHLTATSPATRLMSSASSTAWRANVERAEMAEASRHAKAQVAPDVWQTTLRGDTTAYVIVGNELSGLYCAVHMHSGTRKIEAIRAPLACSSTTTGEKSAKPGLPLSAQSKIKPRVPDLAKNNEWKMVNSYSDAASLAVSGIDLFSFARDEVGPESLVSSAAQQHEHLDKAARQAQLERLRAERERERERERANSRRPSHRFVDSAVVTRAKLRHEQSGESRVGVEPGTTEPTGSFGWTSSVLDDPLDQELANDCLYGVLPHNQQMVLVNGVADVATPSTGTVSSSLQLLKSSRDLMPIPSLDMVVTHVKQGPSLLLTQSRVFVPVEPAAPQRVAVAVANLGSTTLRYTWERLPSMELSGSGDPADATAGLASLPQNLADTFSCAATSGVLLPGAVGAACFTATVHCAGSTCLSRWRLRTIPHTSDGHDPAGHLLTLTAAATCPLQRGGQVRHRQSTDVLLAAVRAHSLRREIHQSLNSTILRLPPPSPDPQHMRYLFFVRNRIERLFFHPDVLHDFQALAVEAASLHPVAVREAYVWDLSAASLQRLIETVPPRHADKIPALRHRWQELVARAAVRPEPAAGPVSLLTNLLNECVFNHVARLASSFQALIPEPPLLAQAQAQVRAQASAETTALQQQPQHLQQRPRGGQFNGSLSLANASTVAESTTAAAATQLSTPMRTLQKAVHDLRRTALEAVVRERLVASINAFLVFAQPPDNMGVVSSISEERVAKSLEAIDSCHKRRKESRGSLVYFGDGISHAEPPQRLQSAQQSQGANGGRSSFLTPAQRAEQAKKAAERAANPLEGKHVVALASGPAHTLVVTSDFTYVVWASSDPLPPGPPPVVEGTKGTKGVKEATLATSTREVKDDKDDKEDRVAPTKNKASSNSASTSTSASLSSSNTPSSTSSLAGSAPVSSLGGLKVSPTGAAVTAASSGSGAANSHLPPSTSSSSTSDGAGVATPSARSSVSLPSSSEARPDNALATFSPSTVDGADNLADAVAAPFTNMIVNVGPSAAAVGLGTFTSADRAQRTRKVLTELQGLPSTQVLVTSDAAWIVAETGSLYRWPPTSTASASTTVASDGPTSAGPSRPDSASTKELTPATSDSASTSTSTSTSTLVSSSSANDYAVGVSGGSSTSAAASGNGDADSSATSPVANPGPSPEQVMFAARSVGEPLLRPLAGLENVFITQVASCLVHPQSVAAGISNAVFAVSDAGALYAWGDAASAKANLLGFSHKQGRAVPTAHTAFSSRGLRVSQIACGTLHVLALTHIGAVYSWGSNDAGALGVGDKKPRLVPTLVDSISPRNAPLEIADRAPDENTKGPGGSGATGGSGLAALGTTGRRAAGSVNNPLGLTGPKRPTSLSASNSENGIASEAEGSEDGNTGFDDSSSMVPDGGADVGGEVDDDAASAAPLASAASQQQQLQLQSSIADPVVFIDCGAGFSVAVTRQGYVYTWGDGRDGALGHGDSKEVDRPKRVEAFIPVAHVTEPLKPLRTGNKGASKTSTTTATAPSGSNSTSASAGSVSGVSVTPASGGAGNSGAGVVDGGAGGGSSSSSTATASTSSSAAAAVAVAAAGGSGSSTSRLKVPSAAPASAPTSSSSSSSSSSSTSSSSSSSVMLAGSRPRSANGGVGEDAVGNPSFAGGVDPGTVTIREVRCGSQHCVALAANGTIYTWGKNTHGQLGTGNEEDQLLPFAVASLKVVPPAAPATAGGVGGGMGGFGGYQKQSKTVSQQSQPAQPLRVFAGPSMTLVLFKPEISTQQQEGGNRQEGAGDV